MGKKEQLRPQSAPKVIKVTTLFKSAGFALALAVAFIGGWFVNQNQNQAYNQSVINAASSIFEKQVSKTEQ